MKNNNENKMLSIGNDVILLVSMGTPFTFIFVIEETVIEDQLKGIKPA